MKAEARTSLAKAAIVAVVLSNTALADVVFQNTTTDLKTRFNIGVAEVGDQVVLDGGSYTTASAFVIKSFSLQYWGANLGANATMDVRFYANDGVAYDVGSQAPGTLLWDSGAFGVASTDRATLTFTTDFGNGVAVPKSFTWSVMFNGIAPGGSAGLDLYSPPTVGKDFSDYWLRTDVGWVLAKSENQNVDFAAKIDGTPIPEPTSLLLFGGLLFAAPAIWRKVRPQSA